MVLVGVSNIMSVLCSVYQEIQLCSMNFITQLDPIIIKISLSISLNSLHKCKIG